MTIGQTHEIKTMFMIDMPDMYIAQAQRNIAVVPAGVLRISDQVKTILMGDNFVWDGIDNMSGFDRINGRSWDPAYHVCSSLKAEDWFRRNGLNTDDPKCIVSLIEQVPAHGRLELQADGRTYTYRADTGFIGMDWIVFIVDAEGKKIRLNWPVNVTEYEFTGEGNDESRLSPEEPRIPALLDAVGRMSFANLLNGTVGQTSGEGLNATITLDDNAAGHGWYFDYTPYLNEEFLPTSNPNEWIARHGSEAEGRMDLLSVLRHEYGHVLGLDHSANSHDFMAATLTPVKDAPTAGDQSLTTAEDTSLAGNLLELR